ncbi:MAG: MFS transporter [Gemmatimonadetes bacterium]|nr:MFS transporter [Gemmatimonadota bacterium]MDA1104747.1 MFS transporter [Gemmatimonadota bacterium]
MPDDHGDKPTRALQRLSRGRLLAYSAPSLVTAVAALPLALFVPAFYADDLGVSLAAVGGAIALSRLLDVVTDPLIGALSDRLRLPLGRRKPWMLLGAPLFLLGLWKVFVPGDAASATHLAVWSAILYLGFTMIDLPHKAWGAELSTDYDERSRVTGWREAIATVGQVGLLAAVVWLAVRGVEDAADQLRGIATAVVIGLPILLAVCVMGVPEGAPEGFRHERRSTLAGLKIVARNPAFLRMVGCVLFFVSGVAIQGTLHRLVLADVMADERRFPTMILLENVATLAGIPLWLATSVRIGKHRALLAAAMWIAVWSLPLVFLREGHTAALIAIIVVRGSSFASILFLANSIAADVIDVDTLESGEQRSGLFFAAWGMTIKLSLAFGVVLGTTLPSVLGYDPADPMISAVIQGRLMWVYGGVPALLMGIGALFLYGFPITRERHAEVRAELLRRSTRYS